MSSTEQSPLLGARVTGTSVASQPTPSPEDIHQSLKPSGLEISTSKRRLIMFGTYLTTMLGALDNTITASLAAPIASQFQASHQASWLGSAFFLASITFSPGYGRLTDIMGRKWAKFVALSMFTLGTLICTFAPSMKWLVFGRFVAGAGGGGVSTTNAVISSDLYQKRERILMASYGNFIRACGLALGGPFGGFMYDWLGWRSAFGVQRTRALTVREGLSRVDFAGSATLFFGFGSFLLALSLRNNELLPWSNPYVIIFTALTPIFLAFFFFVEARVAKEPVMDLSLLRQRLPFFVYCVTFASAVRNFDLLFNIPVYYHAVEGLSVASSGAHLVPISAAGAISTIFGGMYVRRTGVYWGLGMAMASLTAVTVLLVCFLQPTWPSIVKWILLAPYGAGNMATNSMANAALLSYFDPSRIGHALGCLWLFRATGQIIGLAFSSAIFQALLVPGLRSVVEDESLVNRIKEDSEVVNELDENLQALVRLVFHKAVKGAFAVALVGSLLSVVCFAFVSQVHPIGSSMIQMTQQLLVHRYQGNGSQRVAKRPRSRAELRAMRKHNPC